MLHSLQAAWSYRKGRRQGLCDLLADESSEKGIKECFTQGEISETGSWKGSFVAKEWSLNVFVGRPEKAIEELL